jgi:hypothetical protein
MTKSVFLQAVDNGIGQEMQEEFQCLKEVVK